MSGFSIDELDAIARGVGGASAPASGKTKAPLAEPTQEDLNKARRTKVLNPQLQPDTEQTVTASQPPPQKQATQSQLPKVHASESIRLPQLGEKKAQNGNSTQKTGSESLPVPNLPIAQRRMRRHPEDSARKRREIEEAAHHSASWNNGFGIVGKQAVASTKLPSLGGSSHHYHYQQQQDKKMPISLVGTNLPLIPVKSSFEHQKSGKVVQKV